MVLPFTVRSIHMDQINDIDKLLPRLVQIRTLNPAPPNTLAVCEQTGARSTAHESHAANLHASTSAYCIGQEPVSRWHEHDKTERGRALR